VQDLFHDRRVLLGVCGGIAAYKVCEVVSTLAKAGAEIRVILTPAAEAFVSPLTFATLSRHSAYTDQVFWQPSQGRPLHIELAEWAEVFTLAPLTANTLAKAAWGMADNLLTNSLLASTCPVLLVPAMNTVMWQQASVQRNWQTLQQDSRYHALEPAAGILACSQTGSADSVRSGPGRMAEPIEILSQIASLLHTRGRKDLSGQHVLVSAGGTQEYLDPVRFLGNPSTGRMGIAMAQAAQHRGAIVTLVHAPIASDLVPQLRTLNCIPVTNATSMHQAILGLASQSDVIVMAAAVSDLQPQDCATEKLPKHAIANPLPLIPVPDILAELGQVKQPHQLLVGFAAQTGDIVPLAWEKLQRKNLDAIVANPIDLPDSGFGSETNQAILLSQTGKPVIFPACSKLALAHQIWDQLATKIELKNAAQKS